MADRAAAASSKAEMANIAARMLLGKKRSVTRRGGARKRPKRSFNAPSTRTARLVRAPNLCVCVCVCVCVCAGGRNRSISVSLYLSIYRVGTRLAHTRTREREREKGREERRERK